MFNVLGTYYLLLFLAHYYCDILLFKTGKQAKCDTYYTLAFETNGRV